MIVSHASLTKILWYGVDIADVDSFDDGGGETYHKGSIGMDLNYFKRAFFNGVEFSLYVFVNDINILTLLVVVLNNLFVYSRIVV